MSIETNPYSPPEGRVADVVPAGAQRPLASRSQRFFGAAFDGLLFYGALFIMGGGSLTFFDAEGATFGTVFIGGLLILGLLATNLYYLKTDGQSLGKKVMGTRIVTTNGERVGLGRIILLRVLAPGLLGSIPFLGWLFELADALFIFRDDHRCIHDHFAGTKVVIA